MSQDNPFGVLGVLSGIGRAFDAARPRRHLSSRELKFESECWENLCVSGWTPRRVSYRIDDRGGGNAVYPDIALLNRKQKPVVSIECKIEHGSQAILLAIGQCLLYQTFSPAVIVCVPHPKAIAPHIMTLAVEHGIAICSLERLVDCVRDECELRGQPFTTSPGYDKPIRDDRGRYWTWPGTGFVHAIHQTRWWDAQEAATRYMHAPEFTDVRQLLGVTRGKLGYGIYA